MDEDLRLKDIEPLELGDGVGYLRQEFVESVVALFAILNERFEERVEEGLAGVRCAVDLNGRESDWESGIFGELCRGEISELVRRNDEVGPRVNE